MVHNGLDNLGQIIKQIRNRKNLKREELAELAGISPRYLARIENEGQRPSYRVIYKITRAMGISADEFVYPERNTPTTAKDELPVTREFRDQLNSAVIGAYQQALAQSQQTALQGIPQPEALQQAAPELEAPQQELSQQM